MKKTFLLIGIAAVILLLASFLSVWGIERYVESLVHAQIKLLDEHTAGKCGVETVTYRLFRQEITIEGFYIMNPPGYRKCEAVKVGRATVVVSPLALRKKIIHVRQFHIEGVELDVEIQDIPTSLRDVVIILCKKKLNLCELIRSPSERRPDNGRRRNDPPRKTGPRPAREPWLIRVDDFQLVSARVTFGNLPQLGDDLLKSLEPYRQMYWWFEELCRYGEKLFESEIGDLSTFDLPEIRKKDLGAPNGLTPERLVAELLKCQIDAISQKFQERKNEFQNKIRKQLDARLGNIRNKLKSAEQIVDGLIKRIQQELEKQYAELKKDPDDDSLRKRLLVKAIEITKEKLSKLQLKKEQLEDAEAELNRISRGDEPDVKP